MPPSAPRPFDVATVEHLIGLMAKHDLSEISLQEGDQRIKLSKGGVALVPAPAPVVYAPPPTPASGQPVAVGSSPAPAAPTGIEIKSEMVGTFYSKPKPDKPDYVSVGGKVTPATVVCTIEAMKIFNEVPAGVSGTIREVCVKNGEFVEFGTVLFRVDPN